MKFAIASEHRDFFSKNGYIEFADVLSSDQVARLNNDIQQALVNRLKLLNHSSLERCSAAQLFAEGRDVWRAMPAIKRIVLNPSLAEIAWEFCQARPLRIGYDQLLPAQNGRKIPLGDATPYRQMLGSTDTLLNLSSIQGLVSGLLICLKGAPATEADGQDLEPKGIFPTVAGHGIYLAADLPVDFSTLDKDCEYLLITYATQKSVYIHNQNDPLGTNFRQWGYTLSDALTDKLNPIVLR